MFILLYLATQEDLTKLFFVICGPIAGPKRKALFGGYFLCEILLFNNSF